MAIIFQFLNTLTSSSTNNSDRICRSNSFQFHINILFSYYLFRLFASSITMISQITSKINTKKYILFSFSNKTHNNIFYHHSKSNFFFERQLRCTFTIRNMKWSKEPALPLMRVVWRQVKLKRMASRAFGLFSSRLDITWCIAVTSSGDTSSLWPQKWKSDVIVLLYQ